MASASAPTASGSPGPSGRALDLAVAGVLGIATAWAFAAIGSHGFINYDDSLYLTQNAMTQRGLSAETVRWAFLTTHAANWHPLTWLSIMADVELFGMDARGHHRMSLAFHVVNTLLFYWLTLRMTGARWASAFAAALFGWHPLRVEAVAWFAQRKDLLSMLFALLALLAYERYARRPRWSAMLAVALALAAGLLAKPVLVTLPFALLLLDRWPLRRVASPAWLAIDGAGGRWARASFARLVGEKGLLFGLVVLSSLLTLVAQRGGGAVNEELPWIPRLLNAGLAYWGYLAKTIWPTELSPYYPYPSVLDLPSALAAILGLVLLTVGAWRARDRRPFLLTGWLFFLGTLVPMIGIVQVGSQAMADRYTYFSGIGLFWIAAFGGRDLLAALRVPVPARAIAAAAILAALFAATRTQVGYWRDSITLFTRAVELDPRSHVAHGNLAAELIERGDYEGGRRQLDAAVEARPDVPDLWVSLGSIDARQGDHRKALAHYRRALEIAPGHLMANLNYGLSAVHLGNYEEAIPLLEAVVAQQARGHFERLVMAHRALAHAYRAQGRAREAAAHEAAVQRLRSH